VIPKSLLARLSCLLPLVLTLVHARAMAQETGGEQTAAARALFEEGVSLSDHGDWAQASDRFRRAYALRPSPAVAFNLATALEHTGGLVEASELLRRVRRQARQQTLKRDALRILNRIQGRIGHATIQLTGETTDVEVAVDGHHIDAARIGVRIPIDPGHRVITASRGGSQLASREVDIADGGTADVTLDVPATPPEVENPPTPAEVAQADPSSSAASQTTAPLGSASNGAGDRDEGEGVSPWVWVGIGALAVVAGVTVVVLLSGGGTSDPVPGNAMPGVVEFP